MSHLIWSIGRNVDGGSPPLVTLCPLHAPDEVAQALLVGALHIDIEQVDVHAVHVVVEGQAAGGIVRDLGADQSSCVVGVAGG